MNYVVVLPEIFRFLLLTVGVTELLGRSRLLCSDDVCVDCAGRISSGGFAGPLSAVCPELVFLPLIFGNVMFVPTKTMLRFRNKVERQPTNLLQYDMSI